MRVDGKRDLHPLLRRQRPLTEENANQLRDEVAALTRTDPSEAAALAASVVAHLDAHPSPPVVAAQAWRSRAEAALFQGEPKSADEAYARAAEFALQARRPDLERRLSVGWVHVLAHLGRNREAERLATRLSRELRQTEDFEYLAKLQMNRGNLAYHSAEYELANRLYREAENAFELSGLRDATVISLQINRAIALTHLGHFEEAVAELLLAESNAENEGMAYLIAHARFNRAHVERVLGRFRDALTGFEISAAVFREQETPDLEAATSNDRAELMLELGMPAEAAELAAEAALIFRQQNMELDALLSTELAVRGYRQAGQLERAHEHLAKLTERVSAPSQRLLGLKLEHAEVLLALGKFSEFSAQLRGILRETSDPATLARVDLMRLRLAIVRRRWKRAGSLVSSLLRRRSRLNRSDTIQLLRLAASVDIKRGDRSRAKRRLQTAARFVEEIRALAPNPSLRSSAFGAHLEVYFDLIRLEVTGAHPSTENLLRWTESARARTFQDRFRGRHKAKRVSSQLNRLQSQYRHARRLQSEAAGEGDTAKTRTLHTEVRELETRILDSRLWEVDDYERIPPVETDSIQDGVRRHETGLAYFCLDDEIHVLVTSMGTVRHVSISSSRRIVNRELDRFRFYLEGVDFGEFGQRGLEISQTKVRESLQRLHSMLLEPLEIDFNAARRLLIAPHGELHGVPFECMFDAVPAMADSVITRIPTLSSLGVRRRRSHPVDSVRLFSTPLEGLETEKEVTRLRDLLQTHSQTGQASARQLVEAFESEDAVHLATHTELRRDNPEFSELRTTDGSLFISDLTAGSVRSPVVFLSACETGVIRPGPQDELDGMAHALLSAGGRHLVASRWKVEDSATTDLAVQFYRFLFDDPRRDPALALHNAMKACRQVRSHPYFWGGFAAYSS